MPATATLTPAGIVADALDLLAKYAHLELGPAADVCPVHEPGDEDCTPTFGAPCTGRHEPAQPALPADRVTQATPEGTLVRIGPGWPPSKRGDRDSATARFLLGPALGYATGADEERGLLDLEGEPLAIVVPASWLRIADDAPHSVTLLPAGTFPGLEAELVRLDELAADTSTGAVLEHLLARRLELIAELGEAGRRVYLERRHAAELYRLALEAR